MKIRNILLLCLSVVMLLSSCEKADSSSGSELPETEIEESGKVPAAVSLFGEEVTIPCKFGDLPDNIVCDPDFVSALNSTDAFIDIYDGEIDETKSNRIGRAVVEDCLENGKWVSDIGAFEDKRISCINIENICGGSTGRYDLKYGGFGYDTSKEDFKAKFGEPDVELPVSECLIYYFDDEGRTFVDIGFKNGAIDSLDISLYDWSGSRISADTDE